MGKPLARTRHTLSGQRVRQPVTPQAGVRADFGPCRVRHASPARYDGLNARGPASCHTLVQCNRGSGKWSQAGNGADPVAPTRGTRRRPRAPRVSSPCRAVSARCPALPLGRSLARLERVRREATDGDGGASPRGYGRPERLGQSTHRR